MAASVLGKRTRGLGDTGVQHTNEPSPIKRVRRSVGTLTVNEKKGVQPTSTPSDDLEDQENKPPTDFESCLRNAEKAPPKPRTKVPSSSATQKANFARVAPVTPQTPRHYDVFATTPTSTPRHRVASVGILSKRLTPRTPVTPSSCQTVYHQARQLFSRSADPGELIGRDGECAQLRAFLDRCTSSTPSGCIYVSGPPGTGKSAMVKRVTDEVVAEAPQMRTAYINCMTVKTSKDLHITLLKQLSDDAEIFESDAAASLQKMFHSKKLKHTFLVVLDEVDHILTLDLESMTRVFEWSLQKSSRLALVGIANALDLTDRFLPRLKARNLKPEMLPVLPYTAAQVKAIITNRLQTLLPKDSSTSDFVPFFHPAAIELCSRKVSTQSGDLRRAFEVCRKAIDLVEQETRMKHGEEAKEKFLQQTPTKKKVLGEKVNMMLSRELSGSSSVSAALMRSLQSLTVQNAPRVSISHLNKVTAAAFSNGTGHRLKTLNLQQRAALCALVAIEKRNRSALGRAISGTPSKLRITAPSVKCLFDTYCLLCKCDSVLHPLSSSEFREVMGSLETLSLIAPMDGKTGSFAAPQTPSKRARKSAFGSAHVLDDEKRVASQVSESEIEQAVEGPGADILRSILSGEALD